MDRYFRHFMGGLYRYVGTAKDSETLEEILCEDGVHDYRRGLWEIVEARILFSAMKSFFP